MYRWAEGVTGRRPRLAAELLSEKADILVTHTGYIPERTQGRIRGPGGLLTPYRIWIHSPRLAAALDTIGTFLNSKSSLSECVPASARVALTTPADFH